MDPDRIPVPYGWSKEDLAVSVTPARIDFRDIPAHPPDARGEHVALDVGNRDRDLRVTWTARPKPYVPEGLDKPTFERLVPPWSILGSIARDELRYGKLHRESESRYYYEALAENARTLRDEACRAICAIHVDFTDLDGVRWRRFANRGEVVELSRVARRARAG